MSCKFNFRDIDHNSAEKISIIIPTLNEAKTIAQTLASTQQGANNVEVIVVDGASQDNTVAIAQQMQVKVLSASTGRAMQMNAGALVATGDILLFLHADTCLPGQFDTLVRTTLAQPGAIAGAFALRIDATRSCLRLIELGVNWRSRWLQMPYGDQAIFLKSAIFHKLGGFPELPLMEDFELMRQLRRLGRIAIVPAPVLTSARRWLKQGVFKTTFMNQMAIITYLLRVSPEKIRRWYRK